MNQIYLDTARLLTQVAPLVFVDDTFALKGGTAINLFVRDMPRLSVDLDLVFPDHTLSRDKALARIKAALRQAADRLKKRGFQTHASAAGARETKLLVRRGRIEIKVEVNFVMRGTVQPVRRASLTPTARDVLMADLDIPVVSLEDMYGGKVGRRTGSSAPARPLRRDAAPHALLAARERMVRELQQGLDDNERRFLLSLVAGAPDWSLLNVAHLEHLPGIRWKLHNLAQLQKTNAKKFAEQADTLTARLDATGSGAAAPPSAVTLRTFGESADCSVDRVPGSGVRVIDLGRLAYAAILLRARPRGTSKSAEM